MSVVQKLNGNYICGLRIIAEWFYNFGTKMFLITVIYWSNVFCLWSVLCYSGGFFVGKRKSDISAMYLQNILVYLTPIFVCNSVP